MNLPFLENDITNNLESGQTTFSYHKNEIGKLRKRICSKRVINSKKEQVMKQKMILVAVDSSDYSGRALEKAIELSKLMDTKILLVHCHRRFPSILGEPYLQNAITAIIDEANKIVEPYRKALSESGTEFSERILEGPAGNVIPNIARIEKCEMIIMGSRGLTDLEGLFIGSVTHRVLHLALCPVLVVR